MTFFLLFLKQADERFEDVSQRLKSTAAKLVDVRNASLAVEKGFEEVKAERYGKFMHMFEHVSKTIDKVGAIGCNRREDWLCCDFFAKVCRVLLGVGRLTRPCFARSFGRRSVQSS